ncbi:MAG: glycosyltransferase [Candidatus Omnitrophica bacterium]|nr:glycosyltransferase [Candidatus Omnitrophota bacterium]
MKKIRVLHIIPDLGTGGAEMLVKNLLLYGDKGSFELSVCSLFPRKGFTLEKEIEASGSTVNYLRKRPGPDVRVPFQVYKLLKTFDPDVVHTHRSAGCYSFLPSSLCGVPVKVHTVHNSARQEVPAAGRLINAGAFKFLGIRPVAISKEIGKTIAALYNIKNIPLIYNGIPINDYLFNPDARYKTRKSLGIADDKFVILHAGRLNIQKNHRNLIEAFYNLLPRVPEALLLCAGVGPLETEIKKMAISRNLTSKIKFLGVRSDIAGLLSAADVFVLSSDWEGLPLVILEAMAASRPIVATAVGGVPEIVINGVSGFLVRPNDPAALAESILKVKNNPAMSQEMGGKALAMCKEKFDIKNTVREYEKLYKEMLSGHEKLR